MVTIGTVQSQYTRNAERTVLVSGFSKAYAMTGWRLGYACGHPDLIKAMTKVHQFGIMSAPTTAQYAAIEALKNGDDDIEMMREEYDMRRRVIVKGFNDMGLECFEPKGAFYAFPSIQSTGLTSDEFCENCLREKKVAVIPWQRFGHSGEGFIRCSYAYSIREHQRGIEPNRDICKTQIILKAVCADKGACGFLGSTLNFKKVLDLLQKSV